jgi:hypothetical protein
MVMDRFGVWSPHRDSNSVRSFKAALSLRPEAWRWYDNKEQASWWVIDGTLTTLGSLTDAILLQKKEGPIEAVVLAPTWNLIEDPIWTFFKAPLNVKLLYGWIDRCLQRDFPAAPAASVAPAPAVALTGRQLKLKRWPNLPHYTAHSSQADAVSLTLACARLLENWTRYEDASATAGNAALFDTVLVDAQSHGILEIRAPEAVSEPEPARTSTPAPSPALTANPDKTDAWSLVKRLLKKFA